MATGLKKLPKRPIKQNYIDKYGFEGERIWRLDLLKYNEQKNAIEHYNEGLKEQARRAKEEERRTRELEQLNKSTSKSKTSKPAGKRTCKPKTAKPAKDKLQPKERKRVLAGEVYDLIIQKNKYTPEQRKRIPDRESFINNNINGVGKIPPTSVKDLEKYKKELLADLGKPSGPAKKKPTSPKTAKPAQTSPKTATKPSEAKSYTVRQGRMCKTFATKSEAQACASQAKNKATITETTKPPTHKIVKFAVKK